MSRNYDNWERLVAAVVKREQIWQLCHQDSISTISSSDYSCRLELYLPVSLGSFGITDIFESIRCLRQHNLRTTDLVRLVQDVQLSDQRYLAAGTKAVIKSLDTSTSTRKITEDEFEQHMIVLGNCSRENVATPSAYFFSETTKLIIVYDYYSQGSVFDLLFQGNRSGLNWESRLRIAIGAARGIAHIHTQCGGQMVHGNIKSSNIFVNRQHYGCVSDFGLAEIVESSRHRHRAYEHRFENVSQMSDVYSFGLLLIELVTGALPAQASYVVDCLRSFQPYEWKLRSAQYGRLLLLVDELDMLEEKASIYVDEKLMDSALLNPLMMQKTLEVARRCLALFPEDRPPMSQVALELQKIADSVPEDLSAHKSRDKKRVWNRFLRFGTRQTNPVTN